MRRKKSAQSVIKRGKIAPVKREERRQGRMDYGLLAVVVGLSLFGLLMLYDASAVVAAATTGNKYYYLIQQATNLGIGLAALFIASRINYHFWQTLAPIGLVVGLVMLVLVFVPHVGMEINGARRWIGVGKLTLQPAYLLCFALIVYLASWLADRPEEKRTIRAGLLPFGVLIGLVLLIVAGLQKDLGSSLILALTSLSLYFLSGMSVMHLILMIPAGLVGVGVLVLKEAYRMSRILTFLGKSSDNGLDSTYHINQVTIALGSGGLFGVGLGQSRQKYEYIPEVQTDSIFAVLGEELGYIGSLMLIAAFGYLLWRGYQIALHAPDEFGRLLSGGIMTLIAIQVFMNLFAMSGLIPLTGVPLPFISNGGTSLIVLLFSVGIVLNISRQIDWPNH